MGAAGAARRVATLPLCICILGACAVGTTAAAEPPPAYQGCLTPAATKFKYCDSSLSFEARARALVEELTLEEKVP